jgi:uncharacterized RDD family membrane protein YckC
VDPFERLRSAGRRVTDPMESLAQAVAERVVEVVVQALDLNEIISRIDVNRMLDEVDVNHVLERIDMDRLLDRVDVNGIVGRADVDAIVRRVDIDALMDRVDVNALIDRVDVDTLIAQTDLGGIIAKSTSGFASEALDTLRSQMVMIDQYADRVVWRAERRKGERPRTPSYAPHDGGGPPVHAVLPHRRVAADRTDPPHEPPAPAGATVLPSDPAAPAAANSAGPTAPPYDPAAPPSPADGTDLPRGPAVPAIANPPRALVTPGADPLAHDDTAAGGHTSDDRRAQSGSAPRARGTRAHGTRGTWTSLHGHYAGGASRLAAWIIDAAASTGAFTVALAAVSYAATVITGHSVSYSRSNWIVATIYVLWLFAYFAYPWGLSGKSLGMAVLGIRVVAKDGTHAGWRRAVVRTLALPLSFLLLGLGLVPILLQKQNRALHDFIAGTAVVYAWDARAARIRFLARTTDTETAQSPQT